MPAAIPSWASPLSAVTRAAAWHQASVWSERRPQTKTRVSQKLGQSVSLPCGNCAAHHCEITAEFAAYGICSISAAPPRLPPPSLAAAIARWPMRWRQQQEGATAMSTQGRKSGKAHRPPHQAALEPWQIRRGAQAGIKMLTRGATLAREAMWHSHLSATSSKFHDERAIT